jgi:hypothetical protein
MRESYFWPLRAVLMFALVLVLATSAWAQGGKKTEPKDKVSKDSYAVVEVNGALSVTTTDAAKKLKKEKAAEYKREVQRWNREKKAAQKRKEKFEEAKPQRPKVKVLRSRIKTQAEAQEWMQKHQEKASKKTREKPVKEPEEGAQEGAAQGQQGA